MKMKQETTYTLHIDYPRSTPEVFPRISFRTDNGPFKAALQGFTQKIIQMMKSERLFESQGGPIILSQIENEYGVERNAVGDADASYINWAAKMALGLDTGVPWVMCKEDDAPDPIINACNGFYCDSFLPNRPYKPKMWTEAWSGRFTEFGGPIYQRPVQDLAFAVARFMLKGGSYVNYYMLVLSLHWDTSLSSFLFLPLQSIFLLVLASLPYMGLL